VKLKVWVAAVLQIASSSGVPSVVSPPGTDKQKFVPLKRMWLSLKKSHFCSANELQGSFQTWAAILKLSASDFGGGVAVQVVAGAADGDEPAVGQLASNASSDLG